ncbi:MAG TPA: carboxypeptidase-like regulatory domain-containing protein [Vicinamibacterales bacterium]|nr:carboxypeptidase-like regulatory domain-containing protein [Vicinamibacterales bacterium]
MRGRIVLAALLSCSIPAAAAMLPQQRDPRAVIATAQTGTGSISGVVTDRRQSPLATAIVRIAIEGVPTKRETVTDPGGRFRFTNLPAGRYAVSAQKAGYIDEWFGRSAGGPANELLTLGPGQAIADVSMVLTKTGAISGIVTGEMGEPIRAQVRVMPRNQALQPSAVIGSGAVTTDGRGRYRIGSLAPGEYLVTAHSLEATDARKTGADGRDREFSFVDTYFPGSLRPQDAAPVRVNEGDVIGDIDIQVSIAPAGTAEGQLTHVSGLPIQGQQVVFVARNGIRFSGVPMDGGRFRIAGLPYGEYEVFASGAVKPEGAPMQIGWARGAAVIGPDRVNLALTLAPGAGMSGRVSIEDGTSTSAIKMRATPIGFSPTSINSQGLLVATVTNDGAFAFANLAPGRYLISLDLPPKVPWSIERVAISGQPVTDGTVELVGGLSLDGVQVALIDTRAEISGTVTASDGSPLAGVLVVAFPDRGFVPGGRTVSATTDAAGRYLLTSVPLGRHRVEAVVPQGARPEAIGVVIDARGQKKVVDIRR